MTTVPTKPRKPAAPPAKAPTKETPPGVRVCLIGDPGWGKTTIGAYARDARMILGPGEDGYLTLRGRGLVPEIPCESPADWPGLLALIDLTVAGTPGTLVVDALGSIEELCAAHVCRQDFAGNWGEKGYSAWGRGPKIVAREWLALLARLTTASRKGWDVLLIGHARVRRHDPPDGPSYDRYECDLSTDACWARTKQWAEAVLFATFRPIVDVARPESNTARAHGKAIAQQRILRAQYSAIADAKNQYGLDAEYVAPDDAEACASAFWQLVLPKETS